MHFSEVGSYAIEELIFDSSQFQRYRATDIRNGEAVLIKRAILSEDPADRIRNSLLLSAAIHQERIRRGPVLAPLETFRQNGSLFSVYPLLDTNEWKPLSAPLLAKDLRTTLLSMAIAVDFLHLLGLVHTDLKIENFMIKESEHETRAILIDLDFLHLEHSMLNGLIVGSPGLIPPEVLANDCIVAQSDLYSLGCSLRNGFTSIVESGHPNIELKRGLESLIEKLTAENWVNRPVSLIDSLARSGILKEQDVPCVNRTLLAHLTLNSLDTLKRRDLRQGRHEGYVRSMLKLGNVPDEILKSSSAAAGNGLHRVLRIWRKAIQLAHITRHGEFFSLSVPNEVASMMLQQFDQPNVVSTKLPLRQDCASDVADTCRALNDAQEPLRALCLATEFIKNTTRELPTGELAQLNEIIGDCNADLGRFSEAAEHYELTADLSERPLPLLQKAVHNFLRGGRYSDAEKILDRVRSLSESSSADTLPLPFGRFAMLCAMASGRLDKAERLLKSLQAESEKCRDKELSQVLLYQQGVLAWRRGDFAHALECYKRVQSDSASSGCSAGLIEALTASTALYCDTGEYLRAYVHGVAALRAAHRGNNRGVLPGLHMALCYASVRLARERRARFWLEKCLESVNLGFGGASLGGYYVLNAFVAMQWGRSADAASSLGLALSILGRDAMSSHAIKVFLNLAELHLWKGDLKASRGYALSCMESASKLGDSASTTEARLLHCLAQEDQNDAYVKELVEISSILTMKRSSYRAAMAAFHLHCAGGELPPSVMKLVSIISEDRHSRHVPLFAALSCASGHDHRTNQTANAQSIQWRNAYQILSKAGQHYLAAWCAMKVADVYAERKLVKHAEKFLLQAKQHAQILGNKMLGLTIATRLERIKQTSSERVDFVRSLQSVSVLMRDLGDYSKILNQLVQFAVEQVGAERGVLLLSKPESRDLQVIASYNCDSASADEIAQVSSSISRSAVSSASPVFVDNALNDERTNQYQSVIAHNILSVACIPLQRNSELIGALYLDHHSLPSLFGEDDRRIMEAIANLLVVTIFAARDIRGLALQTDHLSTELQRLGGGSSIITRDPAMLRLLEKVPQIAESNSTILIYGETGTGKDLICDMLHKMSTRASEPFVKLNCASLTASLVESELFGIAKAVATGVAQRPGRFEVADGGTLFLDEIAELPLDVQAKILRAVENKEIERVGSYRTIHIDVRLILATHCDLELLIEEKRFREDLFHRISTVIIEIPPLRERRCDIPLLIDHFLEVFASNRQAPRLTQEAYNVLVSHPWPGNVRQLRSVIEYCCVFYPGETVGPDQLPPRLWKQLHPDTRASHSVAEAEKERILKTLRETKGNRAKAATLLGLHISALRRRIKKFGVDGV